MTPKQVMGQLLKNTMKQYQQHYIDMYLFRGRSMVTFSEAWELVCQEKISKIRKEKNIASYDAAYDELIKNYVKNEESTLISSKKNQDGIWEIIEN